MTVDASSPNTPPTIRARRWTRPPSSPSRRGRPHRFALRLIGIPAVAVLGVFLYRGVREHLVLPECDSANAKQSLSTLLKELALEPVRDEPIKTVSASKEQVVCNVTLALQGGGSVAIDYTFYWQDGKIRMKWNTRKSP